MAQQDNWDAYMAQYPKGPGSTLVNLSAKNSAPDKNLKFVLITGVTFKDCVDGLPTKEEFDKLYVISDSVKSIVDKLKVNKSVGTFTYQCQRLDYYYLADTSGLRGQLIELYKKYIPAYVPYINIKTDNNWEAYLTFLYPNEDILDHMQNEKVVIQLKNAGDDGKKERQVDHWLYFATESDRKCMFGFLGEAKFIVESLDKTDYTGYPYSLHISRVDKADINSISRVTKALRAQVKKCNGVYDGWESPVAK